jgi:hypothetical protein
MPWIPMKNNGFKTVGFTIHVFPVENNAFEGIQGLQVTLGTGRFMKPYKIS